MVHLRRVSIRAVSSQWVWASLTRPIIGAKPLLVRALKCRSEFPFRQKLLPHTTSSAAKSSKDISHQARSSVEPKTKPLIKCHKSIRFFQPENHPFAEMKSNRTIFNTKDVFHSAEPKHMFDLGISIKISVVVAIVIAIHSGHVSSTVQRHRQN